IMDTHTAVASRAWRNLNQDGHSTNPAVIVSTASPYKFPEAVLAALGVEAETLTDQELLERLNELSKVPYPPAIEGLLEAERLHDTTIEVSDMREFVRNIAR
ncbi:MAG TPA: threonine synthase, partial [Facklamia tabacinasalis]|nr:threonine synthase [Ruoffia tabacinasalis]